MTDESSVGDAAGTHGTHSLSLFLALSDLASPGDALLLLSSHVAACFSLLPVRRCCLCRFAACVSLLLLLVCAPFWRGPAALCRGSLDGVLHCRYHLHRPQALK